MEGTDAEREREKDDNTHTHTHKTTHIHMCIYSYIYVYIHEQRSRKLVTSTLSNRTDQKKSHCTFYTIGFQKPAICADSWFLESNGQKGAVGFFSDHKSSSAGSIPKSPNRQGSNRDQVIPPEPSRTCKLMRMTGSEMYRPVGKAAQPLVGLWKALKCRRAFQSRRQGSR
jgi:hypothetical protein